MRRLLPLIFVTLVTCGYREHLSQFLHEFEELAKENIYFEHVSNVTVLSAMKIYVRINLQNNVFHAVLQPHTSLFHPDLVVRSQEAHGSVKSSINVEEYLEGILLDEPDSRVLIHIKDNIVTGTIQTADNEKYFIEPSHRHVKEPHDFHMIAYKLSDVKFNFTSPGDDNGHFCAHESHDKQQDFSDEDYDFMVPKNDKNAQSDGFEYSRKKRASEQKNRCPLALIGDYSFFLENNGDEANAFNYMIGLIQQIDVLYQKQSLDPDNSEYYRGYGFSIKHLEVVKSTGLTTDTSSYLYYDTDYTPGVSDLLKNFAYGDWGDYCLSHLFTNYDFSGGVLGLAYVAAASTSRVGGVCTRTYQDGSGKTKHLNVGLTTSINYGRTLLTSELVFVTGHEFGHNWGSSHDSDTSTECAPSGNRFMMYPAAVDGSQTNNEKFSNCSKQAIKDVLESKSSICFTVSTLAMCGNGVTEEGEDCDPGFNDTSCCVKCQFAGGAVCEDTAGICCDNCQFEPYGETCLTTNWNTDTSNYCVKDYECPGDSMNCTAGMNVPDGTVCYDNGRCSGGVCEAICEYNGKYSCLCSDENICQQCCKDTKEGNCTLYEDGLQLANGKLCGNGICVDGLCDIAAQDIQEKLWELYDAMDADMLLRWFRNNIVFTIIVFASIFWIPISIFVDWLDDKYDLGALDDVLGSSKNERKQEQEDKQRLVQESSNV